MSGANPFLASLGWSEFFQESFERAKAAQQGTAFAPGRIVSQARGLYRVLVAPELTLDAAITGKLLQAAKKNGASFPAVGDWVALTLAEGNRKAEIHHVLERKSLIQRKRVGNVREMQLIAANVDYLFIVTSLNEDFDLERLGRYVALGNESGATPVFLLTKTDLCANPSDYIESVRKKFEGIELFPISSKDPATLEPLRRFFAEGMTSVLVGSSGVGKSTLSNFLLGAEAQKTSDVSYDSRGKHTTTARYLLFTRWGGLVIDTPGMQEVSAVGDAVAESDAFADVEELVLRCKFTTCRHSGEPGCAVARALMDGALEKSRWEAYLAR